MNAADPAPTLGEAVGWHLRAMRAKGCSARSLETLEGELRLHLGDWLGRRLDGLRRMEVAERHELLTGGSGPYLANRVMQQLRAVWNTAARRCEGLPAVNPVIAVTFNRVRRRREPVPWEELPAWATRVAGLGNEVRRDLQWFLLLTGLRSLDARTVRWEDVAWTAEGATLHRPRPKGGEDRAFTVPVASAVEVLLARRRARNGTFLGEDDDGWVFPTRDHAGRVTHVAEAKEQRVVDGRKVRWLPSPHRLRDTFATAAHECGTHPLDLKALMNHALPGGGDVTAGYIRPSVGHLRGEVERVAGFLVERAGV
ncbi:tyrosine-type recombinase/integrase [Engelhardtia mirabilis]|uniref:Phage integrase family protein n=1 Tax=Engelhardtia mirabilis TaxID=2528011 RepID=A0A518BE85_9BACT|nr:Phage integrase family protein [Planctomycetes bacterium Pla133]QDU99625.1 Phage integrase family protein [Planctomycetes bacterium Pla86]